MHDETTRSPYNLDDTPEQKEAQRDPQQPPQQDGVEQPFIEPHEMPDTPVASEPTIDAPEAPIHIEDGVSEDASKNLAQSGARSAEFKRVVNLHEKAPSLNNIIVAIGWDAPETVESQDFDLDACVFMLNHADRVRQDSDFVFYNNLTNENKSVRHMGDDKDGHAAGDNEVIKVELNQLSFDVIKLMFTISIHNADERHQTFKDVKSGFIRIVDTDHDEEVARFDLAHENTTHSAIMFASLKRGDGGGWEFAELNQTSETGLYGIASDVGVNIADPS